MKTKQIESILLILLMTLLPLSMSGQTDIRQNERIPRPFDDITKWTNKTIMWVGPHQDDESGSLGTLSLLKANGNKIIMVWYTTGNKGSRDLEMTSERLAQIRKEESIKACGEMGITPEEDTFVWLGYDDGMLEYVPEQELCEKVCRLIRLYRPNAVFSMDPGTTWMQWHKTDHRMSAFVTLDAARAAAYHLYFPHHRINEGLQPYTVTEYFFYSTKESNFEVDITAVSDKKIRSRAWYVSQFGAGNFKYVGPEPDQENLINQLSSNTERIAKGEKVTEKFRRLTESMSF
ncbi:MAG: PIG-L family deacetylase [Bacteroidales bacterium]|jgi:LmbE family N-acetylglucosaminyl deacetylase|nr:PIG-L family deacetylase [Bacteroidales bacterium]